MNCYDRAKVDPNYYKEHEVALKTGGFLSVPQFTGNQNEWYENLSERNLKRS